MNDYIVELRDLRSARTQSTLAVLDTCSPCTDSFRKWYCFATELYTNPGMNDYIVELRDLR